jgi:hypothetical protein
MVNSLPVEIKISIFTLGERFFYRINFFLTIFITEGITESKIYCFTWGHAEHVLKPQSELVILIVEIIHLRKYFPPGGLTIRRTLKYRFKSLAV